MCLTKRVLTPALQRRVALIGDLVGSRDVEDRRALHHALDAALTLVNVTWAAVDPLTPTVGDELQGVYDNLVHALDATLLVRVSMPTPYDVRFGIGIGVVTWLDDGAHGGFRRQDGPAWWLARDAIELVAGGARSRRVPRTLRTWVAADDRADVQAGRDVALPTEQRIAAVNAYLTTRDHLVSQMDGRDRRILQRLLLGWPLQEIADAESVSASAISQRVQRSGAGSIMYSRDTLLPWSVGPGEAG